MAIAARTVSINAAFLQEIKEDHHELRQLIHHTGAMLSRPGWMPAEYDRMVELLGKLRDQLAMHFSLEEAFGYFEDAISVAPHLCRRAEHLRSQHGELYSELCRLAECGEQLLYHETRPGAVDEMSQSFRRFTERLHQHELHEQDLILEALDDDLGTGD